MACWRRFGSTVSSNLGADAGEETSIQRAHAAFYADLVVSAKSDLSAGVPATVAQVAIERDNVRATLAQLLDSGEAETALRVAASLSDFWLLTGSQIDEGRSWLQRALVSGASASPAVRAAALNGLACLALHQGDAAAAIAAASEALVLARAAGDSGAAADALFWLSNADGAEGNLESAVAMAREALKIAQDLGDPEWLSWTMYLVGKQCYFAGDLVEARTVLENTIVFSRQHGQPWCESDAIAILGLVVIAQGDLRRAVDLYAESLSTTGAWARASWFRTP